MFNLIYVKERTELLKKLINGTNIPDPYKHFLNFIQINLQLYNQQYQKTINLVN